MMQVKETIYDGYRFRSRTEARWAVFFKKLGIKYEYEKEGFDLGEFSYLPDFWLPDQKCWIEIKGGEPTEKEIEKAHKLSEYSKFPVYIFFEMPNEDGNLSGNGAYLCDVYGWDNSHQWCECPKCGKIGIEFEGRASRLSCRCFNEERDGKMYNAGSDKLSLAYKSARQARFEYGENADS